MTTKHAKAANNSTAANNTDQKRQKMGEGRGRGHERYSQAVPSIGMGFRQRGRKEKNIDSFRVLG